MGLRLARPSKSLVSPNICDMDLINTRLVYVSWASLVSCFGFHGMTRQSVLINDQACTSLTKDFAAYILSYSACSIFDLI